MREYQVTVSRWVEERASFAVVADNPRDATVRASSERDDDLPAGSRWVPSGEAEEGEVAEVRGKGGRLLWHSSTTV
jgi:hypothetical protein